MRRWEESLRKAEMNGYVKRTEGEDDRVMMMRQCIGEHEARTTMKWSFVSVREGMNGNGGGRTEDGRENKKNTQGRRSMTSCLKLFCGLVSVSCHLPSSISGRYPIFIVRISIRRCIANGERAAQAPLSDRKNLSEMGKTSLTSKAPSMQRKKT